MRELVPNVIGASGPIGIGLRDAHISELLSRLSNGNDSVLRHATWVEVHSENYLNSAPIRREALTAIAQHLPISLHGVGMSLGSLGGLDPDHLGHTRELVADLEPARVSEHACWSSLDEMHFNDLLPLPFTAEALTTLADNVDAAQNFLGQTILIENLAAYLAFDDSTMPEPAFLSELCQRTGCGLLLDLNNLWVSAQNLEFDPISYLDALCPRGGRGALVGEIHLGGHTEKRFDSKTILIDDHASEVAPPVWGLYREALQRFGPTPTLIEWDRDLPPLDQLLAQAQLANDIAYAVHNHGDGRVLAS